MIENRREFYRVNLYHESVLVRFLSNNGRREEIEANIEDISGNGIRFRTSDHGLFTDCEMEFDIHGQSFQRSGKFKRREENNKVNGEYKYVVAFDKVSEKEQSRLTSLLLRIDALRRRK